MNALADREVGNYFNTHFVSSFQKVGTFRIVDGRKQGGNVASYFCTADGEVLHVVAGPVRAAVLLREARWVVETWKLAQLEKKSGAGLAEFFGKAHAERLKYEYGVQYPGTLEDSRAGLDVYRALSAQGKVHLLLAVKPLPAIEQIFRTVFERILGEQVSTSPILSDRSRSLHGE